MIRSLHPDTPLPIFHSAVYLTNEEFQQKRRKQGQRNLGWLCINTRHLQLRDVAPKEHLSMLRDTFGGHTGDGIPTIVGTEQPGQRRNQSAHRPVATQVQVGLSESSQSCARVARRLQQGVEDSARHSLLYLCCPKLSS